MAKSPLVLSKPLVAQLFNALEELGSGHLVVVTGAGVSLASGIATFRGSDPGAVWKQDVTELGTWRYFEEDPVGSWLWYLSRFDKVLDAEPNPAHHALAALEPWHLGRGGQFSLVTQNVDTLHEDAGSRELVKVHGSADRIRCSREGCRYGAPSGSLPRSDFDVAAFEADPSPELLPRCPECDALLRQHVLWFDEFYQGHDDYQWRRVQEAAATMEMGLFVGTSFAVGVTELFLQQGLLRRIPLFVVDPGGSQVLHPAIHALPAQAEELLPAVCRQLGIEPALSQGF